MRQRYTVKRYTVAMLLVGALACTDSNAPIPPAVPPPPPPAASFAIRPALDTARLNDPPNDRVWFVAERADSTVDLWTVSDSSIAQVFPGERGHALVFARRPGTVTITARRQGDSGQATLVIPPFTIWPIFDTIKVGEQVTFGGNHFRFPYDVIEWSSSDSARARVTQKEKNWASVLAQAAGTVTITATHHGDTARATLVIREPQPGEWESIDLGVLDAASGAAIAIGDDGSVVGSLGSFGYPDFNLSGFIYKDGAMHKLPTSGDSEQPVAMSPSGKIAGIAYRAGTSTRQVVIWDTQDAAPRRLDEPMGITQVLINERDDVLIATYDFRSVLWRNNVRVDLGDLGDATVQFPATYANALNNRGQIVGWSNVREVPNQNTCCGVSHPFLWENGVMRDLGVLAPHPCINVATPTDCSWGRATSINASGVVVGYSTDAEGRPRAFIWENGVMRDLGVAPGQTTLALAINDRGQIMGSIGWGCTAFFWENGQAQIIGPICPTGLSPNGEIIGWGAGSDGVHAFMWQAGQLIDLGLGEPRAINANGEVAGVSCRDCRTRPKLWRKKP